MKKKLKILVIGRTNNESDPSPASRIDDTFIAQSLTETYSHDVAWLSSSTTVDNILETLYNNDFDVIILDKLSLKKSNEWTSYSQPIKKFPNGVVIKIRPGIVNKDNLIFEGIREKYPELPIVIYAVSSGYLENDSFSIEVLAPEFPSQINEGIQTLINKNQNLGANN